MIELYVIALVATASFLVYKYGLFSYPVLFILQTTIYLALIPLALDGFDRVTGASATMTRRFEVALMLYVVFFLLGMRISAPLAFKKSTLLNTGYRKLKKNRVGSRVAIAALAVLATATIGYSLVSRNIFTSGDYLFTILGFDLALVLYLVGRNHRPTGLNAIWFIVILVLFVYAGFRYRMLILLLAELIPFAVGRSKTFSRIAVIAGVALIAVFLGAFGQVRSYGTFSMLEILNSDINLRSSLLASGEQTVAIATIAVVERHEALPKIGFEPLILVATQFIPSAIFPNKPRPSYLGSYNEVTTGLRNTGSAMHDLGQQVLMFGVLGLPLSALLLGVLSGLLLNATLKRSPNIHFSIAVIVLFAVLMPTRGYFAQQVTWALTFLLPLLFIDFSKRLVIRRR